MSTEVGREKLLRVRHGHEQSRVTFVELFFDLVFVFAITQLSHTLLARMTLAGLAQTTLLFMAVWWVWIYTSWATNWLDPERAAVRLMIFALMLAGLVLSTSIPDAFESKARAFAGAYVFMQLGRTFFMLWALKGNNPANYRNFQRIIAWLSLSALFWTSGAFVEGNARFACWAVALLVEYISPMLRFWTPGLGTSTTSDWDVEGGHLAERCGLFIIIALGESVLVTGAKVASLPWTSVTIAAFLVAFIGSVAMWWLYFNIGAERGSRHITSSDDPGRIARSAYTYMHLPLIAGIVVGAVGDELVLVHPTVPTNGETVAVLLGGPALYLIGNLLFKRATSRRMGLSHMIGLAVLVLLVPVSSVLNPLSLGTAATAVLVIVAVWETLSLRSGGAEVPGRATPAR
jgi:low temperature requirement protein LtrA